MMPSLCVWCSGPHLDHRCDSKPRRDYFRGLRLDKDARARRLSVAFSSPMPVDLGDVLDACALGVPTKGIHGEISADVERSQPRARRVMPWA